MARLIPFTAIPVLFAALLVIPVLKSYSTDNPQKLEKIDAKVLNQSAHVFNDIAQRAIPSVVSISSIRQAPPAESALMEAEGEDPFLVGLGSGVVIRADGTILTNNHVVEGTDVVTVHFDEKTKMTAHVIGTDAKTDLALIRLDHPMTQKLQPIQFANSDDVKVGDWAIAVGSPFGLTRTVTRGMISAKGRAQMKILDIEDFIQTDAAINPGSSGGPLLNSEGNMIGLNTAIFSQSGGFAGVGFAIPSHIAQAVAEEILDHGRVIRGWMGVMAQDLDPDLAHYFKVPQSRGALITKVVPNSPASEMNLQKGDVIEVFNRVPVKDSSELRDQVAKTKVGSLVSLEILHQGEARVLSVTLAEQPHPQEKLRAQLAGQLAQLRAPGMLGLTLQDTPEPIAKILQLSDHAGALVTRVVPGSPAFEAGLAPGDVIVQANEHEIRHAKDFKLTLANVRQGDLAVLYVMRGPTERIFVPLHVPA